MCRAMLRVTCVLLVLATVGCSARKASKKDQEELLKSLDELVQTSEEYVAKTQDVLKLMQAAGLHEQAKKVQDSGAKVEASAERLKDLRSKVPQDKVMSQAQGRELREAQAILGQDLDEHRANMKAVKEQVDRKQKPEGQ